jgi:hypothetical protein
VKRVAWVLGGILVVVGLFLASQQVASERIEVVELQTMDLDGHPALTRLWVVDHEDRAYLRVGRGESQWYQRMLAVESVRLTRRGSTANYTYRARPDMTPVVNQLMREKYTWGDAYLSLLFGGRDDAIAIELIPR